MKQFSFPTLDLHYYNNNTLQEMFCFYWYRNFNTFPHPRTKYNERNDLIHKVDLLRRHCNAK